MSPKPNSSLNTLEDEENFEEWKRLTFTNCNCIMCQCLSLSECIRSKHKCCLIRESTTKQTEMRKR